MMKTAKILALTALAVTFTAGLYSTFAGNMIMMKDEKMNTSTGMDASHLTPKQRYVTLHDGTEPPFQNKYWDHKEPGIYVDAISGEPLFSSTDKFDSGTGWPSFTKPIDPKLVAEFQDDSLGMSRTEIRSTKADAHLGHLFNDGPKESGGQRYCINSASLKFVHKDDLEKEGYAEFSSLFTNAP